MMEKDIIAVLERCGCRRVRSFGDEVRSTCPEESNHSRGTDRNPSFSAKVNPGGYSPAFCQACGWKGTMEYLAREHGMPEYMPERGKRVAQEDWFPAENRNLWGKDKDDDPGPMFPPEGSLRPFQGGIPRYLVDRGVKLETAKRWELGYDREFKRAVFTIRDMLGRLRGVCGRAIYGSQKPKYCHYSWDTRELKLVPYIDHERHKEFLRPEKRLVCYGEHLVQAPARRLLIVEGHLDAVMADQVGVPGVSIQGSKPSDEQVATMLELLDRHGELVIAFDPDAAGADGRRELASKIGGRVPLYDVSFPDGTDVADMVAKDASAFVEMVQRSRIYRC